MTTHTRYHSYTVTVKTFNILDGDNKASVHTQSGLHEVTLIRSYLTEVSIIVT